MKIINANDAKKLAEIMKFLAKYPEITDEEKQALTDYLLGKLQLKCEMIQTKSMLWVRITKQGEKLSTKN